MPESGAGLWTDQDHPVRDQRTARWAGFEYNSDGQPCGMKTWETYEGSIPVGQEEHAGGGWIRPDGTFYRCPDLYHCAVARRLVRDMGISMANGDEPEEYLTDGLRWARIWDNGLRLGPSLRSLTQAQLDKMFDLAQLHPSMREHLLDDLRARREWEESGGMS